MARASNFLALNDPDPKEMSVVDHLDELRHRLIVCIITVMIGSVAGWFVKDKVFGLLSAPIRPYSATPKNPHGAEFVLAKVTDAFTIEIKIAVAVGILLGLPVLLYQIWMFIAPAVSVHARRYAVPFVLIGIVLFLIGISVGYGVFPRVVGFLVAQQGGLQQASNGTTLQFLLTLSDYIAQLALVMLVFGAVFELPVVLTFLALIGVTSSRWLRSKRKYAAMIGLIGAMIITPGADPITPFITGAVVYLLYEFSIISVRLIHR